MVMSCGVRGDPWNPTEFAERCECNVRGRPLELAGRAEEVKRDALGDDAMRQQNVFAVMVRSEFLPCRGPIMEDKEQIGNCSTVCQRLQDRICVPSTLDVIVDPGR